MSSSSSDLQLVRAEIKAWERDFAKTHGRDPDIQFIRDNPTIAEKYKLYKKLSKAAAATTRTPPKTHSRLPAPKSRAADPVHPLPGFNPFSPVKKAAKRSPFATPAKNKPNPRPRTPSDPSPSVLLPCPIPNASSRGPTAAVSRARKRLRGEPVSPSPNKPKRQRNHSQAPPPFPKLDHDSSDGEHETDHELPHCHFTSSFVADSPVKAPAGGKSFKVLFDDVLPALSVAKKPVGPSVAQSEASPDAAFSQTASADHSVPKPHRELKSKAVTSGSVNRIQAKLSAQIFLTKDNLLASSHKPNFKSMVSHISQPGSSNKRALDCSDLPLQSQYPLIPPSPPQDPIGRGTGKGKAKATVGRKKLRVEDHESDKGEDSPDDFTVKVAIVSLNRSKHRHPDDLDWDPLLSLRTRNHDPAAEDQIDANHHASGTFSVDLPDKLRRVLAISPPRIQNSTEERVVRGLLYGDRVGHYDPSRGGAIWDAGETDDGALGDAETEDDWEGEPVPWEVGEL